MGGRVFLWHSCIRSRTRRIFPGNLFCNIHHTRDPYDLFVKHGFVDTWAAAYPHGHPVPFTFHGYLGNQYVADRYGTWHTDWIMVKNLEVARHEIIRQADPSSHPSDHYPVVASVRFRQ